MFSSFKKTKKTKYNLVASLDDEPMRRGRAEILIRTHEHFVRNSRTKCQDGKITRSSTFTAMYVTLVLLRLLQTFLTLTYVSCSIAHQHHHFDSFCQVGTAFSNFSKTILKILSILGK